MVISLLRQRFFFIYLATVGASAFFGVESRAQDKNDFFIRGQVLDVRLFLPQADWENLRQSKPPYSYFSAALELNGQTYAGSKVRKKGTEGSLDEERPSFKIRFDYPASEDSRRRAVRLTLNNALQDFSRIRQCLAYWLYQRAGVVAPNCGFAKVFVNGQALGLYVNVESIDRTFLRRHFSSPAEALYEGTGTNLDANWRQHVEIKGRKPLENEPLLKLIRACYLPEADFLAAVAGLVGEDFYRFWALTVIMHNTDSFHSNGSNFFLAFEPSRKKFHFIPWGADEGFGPAAKESANVYVAGPLLVRRLLAIPKTRRHFERTVKTLLDQVWLESEILEEMDFLAAQVREHVEETAREAFHKEIKAIHDFVLERRRAVLAEIEAHQPRPRAGELVAERDTLFFPPYRAGRQETICSKLFWSGQKPAQAKAYTNDQALRIRLLKNNSELCVSLTGKPRAEVHSVWVSVTGREKKYLPVMVVTLSGYDAG